MEDVQKNENGTTVPQADGKPKKEDKPKRELTPQQVQQRRKMIVFPLMFLAFAGCMYLIFAPSGKEDVNVESVGGFNADIPLPAEDGIIADKQKAYEQAMLNRKQQDKIQSLQDFGFTLDDDDMPKLLTVVKRLKEKHDITPMINSSNRKIVIKTGEMEAQAGFAAKVFNLLNKIDAMILLITTGVDEISVLIRESDGEAAEAGLRELFK